jgi:SAM-dependent methyltransferase
VPIHDGIHWYDAHARSMAQQYEAIRPEELYGWVTGLLPIGQSSAAVALDVGAGSGRDAAWLASKGFDVVAVEPAAAMRSEAQERHPEPQIRWPDDRLPALSATLRLGLAFDVVWVSAVWQHVAASERARAFRKLTSLMKAGGLLVITLRHGLSEPERDMQPVSLDEVEALARSHGMMVVRSVELPDRLGRPDVHWRGVALRLPDDGTGALPLLRHVILNDPKSSTYKLGLLRALCRAADGSAGLAQGAGDQHVALPLGIVALNWLRLYLPLVERGLLQSPNNHGPDGLGFAKSGFRALLGGAVSRLDLRIGARFSGDAAVAVHAALQESADTIARMPATYMTYPNGGPVLPTARRRAPPLRHGELVLNTAYLSGFGLLSVPRELWQALQRFAAWVEPALIGEWERLMRAYAVGQGRTIEAGAIGASMTWSDPTRDVALPRQLALALISKSTPLYCVWSGRRLDQLSLDIDHCFPWSAWACSDLWNLLPAHRTINQRDKRDRLPSDGTLRAAREPILGWWQAAYLSDPGETLPGQFADEASASLPGLIRAEIVPSDIFDAMRLQRLRLHADQQVPEWHR